MQGHGSSNNNQNDLNVEISASGRADLQLAGNNGRADNSSGTSTIVTRLVHAVSVAQPIQSWTVIREHGDFITLGDALSSVIGGIPACPAAPSFDTTPNTESTSSSSTTQSPSSPTSKFVDIDEIVKVRNAAQKWLSNVLLFPGARESPAVNQFLCYGANHVPTQFQGVNWITFTPSPLSSTPASNTTNHGQNHSHNHGHNREAEELDMDVMFGYGDGPVDDHHDEVDDEVDDYDDDDVDYFSATERYQPTVEAVTQDDVMEFQNNADDVEMIEDVGSLAQSLGASHLGRSLQLQAELSGHKPNIGGADMRAQAQQGLNIGGFAAHNSNGIKSVGGIGKAVEKAGSEVMVEGLSDSFYQKKPISAPRLDSFKMIKVVGKGSFGKLIVDYWSLSPLIRQIRYIHNCKCR
jgi:hypothetical protein